MRYAGIDVSKSSLQVAILDGDWESAFPNDPAGRKAIVRKLSATATRVVLEATASYGEDIARDLAAMDTVEVVVANPRATTHFAKALNQRGKTDVVDARMLAAYGAAVQCVAWTPPTRIAYELRQLMRRRRQLVAQQTAEKTRLTELASSDRQNAFLLADLRDNIAHLTERIKSITNRALLVIRQDDAIHRWKCRLITVPGIADVTALDIISELACLPENMDVKQLTAYAGLDPRPHQSGKMDAARRISKRGNKRLRTALFLAAWNTTRFSPHVRAWRDRLIDKGKPGKVADIAVARRLLNAAIGMRRNDQAWDGSKFYRLPEERTHA